jgi:hypothetical protein
MTRCQPAPRPWTKPFAAFPSWFLRIECDRCGKVQMVAQVHPLAKHLAPPTAREIATRTGTPPLHDAKDSA